MEVVVIVKRWGGGCYGGCEVPVGPSVLGQGRDCMERLSIHQKVPNAVTVEAEWDCAISGIGATFFITAEKVGPLTFPDRSLGSHIGSSVNSKDSSLSSD